MEDPSAWGDNGGRLETCKNLGNRLIKEKDYSAALKHYKHGLTFDKNHPQLNCNASKAAFHLGLYDESEKYAVKAIASKSNYEKAYYRAFKAAEKNNDLEKQLDYLLQGIQNCGKCNELLEEASRIQHMVVVSSFFQDSKVDEFFSQSKTARKFRQLEELIERFQCQKDSTAERPHGDKKPTDLFPDFPDTAPCFFGSNNSGSGITITMNGPYQVHGKNTDTSTGSFLQINEDSKSKEHFFKIAAKPKPPAPSSYSPPPKAAPAKENAGFAFSFDGGKSASRSVNRTTESPRPTTPVTEKAKVTPRDSTPAHDKAKVTPRDTPPAHDRASRSVNKTTESPRPTTPVTEKAKMTPRDSTPAHDKAKVTPRDTPPAHDRAKVTTRDTSDQKGGKKPRTDSGSTNHQVNSKESKSGNSITEEIISTLKKGREAFINSFYPLAASFLIKAQTQLKEHSLEDVAEFAQCKVSLAYVICEAKVGGGEYRDIEDGIQILRKLIQEEVSRNFPAVFYLLGLAFYKLNRFEEAREHLEKVNARIKGGVNFTSYPWPGTFDVISSTQKTYLETVVKDLLRECNAYHKPNWICLFEECEKISTHIIPSRKIYFNDPDFSGYVELSCCAKCSLVFHRHCWKAYKDQEEIKRLTDKAILGEPCLTPDCVSSVIVSIKIYDKDGNITHHDSIAYDALAPPKLVVKRSKGTESSTVQKDLGISRGAFKTDKHKAVGGLSSQKNAPVAKRATEDASTTGFEEKEINFQAELEIRKLKLDNIRASDKRWHQFNIDAPDTSLLELTGEEKFVESFFEEVLKNNGPLHVSRVEDYFRDNKTMLENAVPSLRSFYHLLRFLLERSHHFVLMDSVLGLAADLVSMYRTTKDNICIHLKSSKGSLDWCLDNMKVTSAVRDAVVGDEVITGAKTDTDLGSILEADIRPIPRANFEVDIGAKSKEVKANLAANTADITFVPYKKTVFGPEVEKSQSVAPRPKYDEPAKRPYPDLKFDSPSAELDYRSSIKAPVPLQLGAFIKPKNLRVKEKNNADVKSATREKRNSQVTDKQNCGKGKKHDAHVFVDESYNSGVLSVLLEKTTRKSVPVIDDEISVASSASSEKCPSVDDEISVTSSASSEKCPSVIDETDNSQENEGLQTSNLSDVALSSSEPDCEKKEWNSSGKLSEPKQKLLKPGIDRRFDVKDQLLSAGAPPETKPSSFKPATNHVLSKKYQPSFVGTPPEAMANSLKPSVNRTLNVKDQRSSTETHSKTTANLLEPAANRVLNEKDQPSSTGTPSETKKHSLEIAVNCGLIEKDQPSSTGTPLKTNANLQEPAANRILNEKDHPSSSATPSETKKHSLEIAVNRVLNEIDQPSSTGTPPETKEHSSEIAVNRVLNEMDQPSSLGTPLETKKHSLEIAVNRVLNELDQPSSTGTPPEAKENSLETAVNRVLNKTDLPSSTGTPSETKNNSVEPAFDRSLNDTDSLSFTGTSSGTPRPIFESVLNLGIDAKDPLSSSGTPSESRTDSNVNRELNEKYQLPNRAVVESSEEPVLHSVQSFIQAAFRNCQLQLMNSISSVAPEHSLTGDGGEDINTDLFKSPPNSAPTSDTKTATSGSYHFEATPIPLSKFEQDEASANKTSFVEAGQDITKPLSEDSCSFNSACDGVCSTDDFVSDNVVSSLDTSFEDPVNSATPMKDTEVCANSITGEDLSVSLLISIDKSEESFTLSPRSNGSENVLFLDISNLPVVDSGSENPCTPIPEPPFLPVKKDLPPEDTVLFEEYPEDLFILRDKKDHPESCLLDLSPMDLPSVEDLDWDVKDLPENGDLFAIVPPKNVPQNLDDLFEVSPPNEFSTGFCSSKTKIEEKQQGDGLKTEENNNSYKRWQPTQAEWDYIRLSFPRQNHSRLVDGLAIIYDRKGPEMHKLGSEEIVKKLAEIFQLTPCLQYSDDGEGDCPPGNVGNAPQETQSAEILKDDEDLISDVTPWKPPVPLVQVVRLSFPTEEFYKLMFALYLAKLYSDTTRFDDLCDGVANVLNDINEGKCQDYNYEISNHGPYNDESRIIYEKAWRMLIDTRSETGDV